MPDREKVMQWLETCVSGCEEGCPYEYENLVYRVECKADLMRDALALLKEQEAVAPELEMLTTIDRIYRCPKCHKCFFYKKQKYCDQCGQAVKWDD